LANLTVSRIIHSSVIASIVFTAPGLGQTAARARHTSKPELVLQSAPSKTHIEFTGDGRWILEWRTDEFDKAIRVWDTSTGRIARIVPVNNEEDAQARIVPGLGGHRMAVKKKAGLEVWDIINGQQVFAGQDACRASSPVLSPDGKWLACREGDGVIRRWDLSSSQEATPLRSQAGKVARISFSPDSHYLAALTDEGSVGLWNAVTGRPIWTVTNKPLYAAGALDFSKDSRILVVRKAAGSRLLSVSTQLELPYPGDAIRAFGPGNQWVTYSEAEKFWQVWSDARLTLSFNAPRNEIQTMRFDRAGHRLIWCCEDNQIEFMNLSSHRMPPSVALPPGSKFLEFSPDLRWAAVSTGEDSGFEALDLATGKVARVFSAPSVSLRNPLLSPDGHWLAGNVGGFINVWNLVSGRLERSFPCFSCDNFGAFSPNSRLLAWVNPYEAHGIKIWDVHSGAELAAPVFPHALSITFHPDGRRIAAANDKGEVKIWNWLSGEELRSLPPVRGLIFELAFSPDGKSLAARAFNPEVVRIWNLSSGQQSVSIPIKENQDDAEFGIVFSPDGARMGVPHRDRVSVWSAQTGKQVATIPAKDPVEVRRNLWKLATRDGVRAVAVKNVTPNGRLAIYGWCSGAPCIRELTTGRAVGYLAPVTATADWIVFTPDGKFDGSEDGMDKLIAWRVGESVYPFKAFASGRKSNLLTSIFNVRNVKPPSTHTAQSRRSIPKKHPLALVAGR
jgi:WD40 repeat protein